MNFSPADFFLKNYKNQNFVLQQKARILFIILISAIVATSLIVISQIVRGIFDLDLILPPLVAAILMIPILILLRQGYFVIASHTLVIISLAAIWSAMFFGKLITPIEKTDTIIFIFGALSITPLITTKKKSVIPTYYTINAIIFIFLLNRLKTYFNLPEYDIIDYFIDNGVAFGFMGVISYQIFNINKKALDRATETEQALRQSEKKYRLITENVTDVIWTMELDDFKFTYYSPSVERAFGFTQQEAMTLSIKDLMPPASVECVEATIKDMFSEEIAEHNTPKKSKIFELEYLCKNGSTLLSEVTLNFLRDDNDSPAGILGVSRDITARKHAEISQKKYQIELTQYKNHLEELVNERTEELKKAKEASDIATRTKGEFLANMSHEIRTPMNAIIGMNDLLIRTELNRKQREYLNIIRLSSDSLLKLINDILDFSKMEAGKLDFENIPVRLQEVIEEIPDMFLDLIREKEIELVLDIDPNVPEWLITDPLRLQQVLINLTSNAFKFTDQGEICISVNPRSISNESAELVFCIKDTGIGIDASVQKILFDAFAQADGSTTRKYGGTGLGLTICKSIVTMMDGEIWIESNPGKGCSFYFTATFKRATEKMTKKLTRYPEINNMKALLVEDNPSTRIIIKRYVESMGFVVEMTDSAESALDLYEKSIKIEAYDLILMDIRLPGMDGITAAQKIMQETRRVPPKIIIISASHREKDIKIAKESGIKYFITKPIKQSVLRSAILEVFGIRSSLKDNMPSDVSQPEKLTGATILLVEDNPINTTVAMEILKTAEISVFHADNGLEAVKMVKDIQFDAVLMDIQMPEMDGLEATRIIRKKLQKKDIPIIAMTAHTMHGDRDKCLAAGMNDYIPKPINSKQLFSILRKHMPHIPDTAPVDNLNTNRIKSPMDYGNQPGLDIEEGLERLGCKLGRYIKILDDFSGTYENFSGKIHELLKENDLKAAEIEAHSLKGAAANISAKDIVPLAKSLEHECKQGDKIRIAQLLPSVDALLSQVKGSLEKLRQSQNSDGTQDTAPIKFDPESTHKLIIQLEEKLKVADPVESETLVKELDAHLSGQDAINLKLLGKTLLKQIEHYDYEKAEKTLSELAEKLK